MNPVIIAVPLVAVYDSPFQTRHAIREERVASLAATIDRDGLIQPPVARLINEAGALVPYHAATLGNEDELDRLTRLTGPEAVRVQLAVGHTRRLAFEHLRRPRMPVILRDLTDEQMDMLAWQENHERGDLNPVEEAQAIHDRIERRGWTHEQAGEELGLTRSAVSNKLRLLRLPPPALDHLAAGEISEAQARVLVSAYDLEAEHPEIVGGMMETHQGRPAQMLQRALSGVPADRLREYLGYAQQHVEAELERRRNQLDFFASEGSETVDVTQSDTSPFVVGDVAEAIDQINSDHNAAILWIKDPSYIRVADTGVLEKTLAKLRPLVRQIEGIIEDSEAEEIYEHGPALDRISGGIHYDIDRVSRELERRKPAGAEAGDSFDDGGEQLNKISEAQGLPPIEPPTSAETAPPAKPRSTAETLGLPEPVLDEPYLWSAARPVWPEGHEKAGKKMLSEEVFGMEVRYFLPVLFRYGIDLVSRSNVKEDIVRGARRAVQYVANLRCAYALTDSQLARFATWCEQKLPAVKPEKYSDDAWKWRQSSEAKALAAEDVPMMVAAGKVVAELHALEASNALDEAGAAAARAAAFRSVAAFVYHVFFAEMITPIEAEANVTQGDIEEVSTETLAESEPPHPDTGGSVGEVATADEEKPLTYGEKHLLSAMVARYESTQADGHLLAMTDAAGWEAGQALVARGLAQHVQNRFGRVDKARLTLTKEGTDLALQLSGVAAAVAEGVPA